MFSAAVYPDLPQGPKAHFALEKALLKRGLPYTVVKGIQVLDRAAVKVRENPTQP